MKSIYKITNPLGKVYIGQTNNVSRRKYEYKRMYCKKQYMIYNSIAKYGWSNHEFVILEDVETHLVNAREVYYISLYDSLHNGLNLTPGGESYLLTPEQKHKISTALLGGNHTKSKIIYQYSLNGDIINKWMSMKDVERALNYKTTALSAAIKESRPMYGFIWTHGEFINPRALKSGGNPKPIYQYDLNKILINTFLSIQHAVKVTGFNRVTIRRNIQNISSSKKYIWTDKPL